MYFRLRGPAHQPLLGIAHTRQPISKSRFRAQAAKGLESPALQPPRWNAELLHVCTGGRQHKAQKENWLISGLKDHRYLSVKKDIRMPMGWPPTCTKMQ